MKGLPLTKQNRSDEPENGRGCEEGRGDGENLADAGIPERGGSFKGAGETGSRSGVAKKRRRKKASAKEEERNRAEESYRAEGGNKGRFAVAAQINRVKVPSDDGAGCYECIVG